MAGKLTAKQEASLRIDYIPLDEIARFDKNPKKHDVGALVTSIRRYGFRDAPIFDGTLKALVAGHGRLKALEAMKGEGDKPPTGIIEHSAGQWLVPVQMGVDSKSAAEAKAFLIDHNTLTLSGGDLGVDSMLRLYDQGGLEELLRESGPTVSFDGEDIDELINGKKEVVEDDPSALIDAAKELEKKWGTKLGQLWLLGEHRLLCGDSTKAEDVGRLMAGAKADLCFTSPPYALGKSVALSGNKAMAAKANPYGDHEDSAEEWGRLMRDWFLASDAAVSDAWVVNVQPLAGNKRDLVRFIADNAGRLVDVATWDKGHAAPPMAAGVMASRFEWMIIFAANDGASRAVPLSSWRGTVQSVYAAPPQRGNEFSEVHAATMPLHVPAWVMQTLCDQSKSVYEPFCGTGTTLIAADQLGRKCYGIEISPQYVAVILERWSKATGKEPRLES